MARYIDADKLKEHIKDLPTWVKEDGWWSSDKYPNGHFDCEDVVNSINNQPTADVVEVVRCKDCKHYNCGSCSKISYIMDGYYQGGFEVKIPTDFCSYGERKGDE